jgi:hypothetical protein
VINQGLGPADKCKCAETLWLDLDRYVEILKSLDRAGAFGEREELDKSNRLQMEQRLSKISNVHVS